jgi:hypothetical protein
MIKVLDKPHLDLTTPIGRGFSSWWPNGTAATPSMMDGVPRRITVD